MNSHPADDRPTLADLGEPVPLPHTCGWTARWRLNDDCHRCELDQAAAEAEEK